MTKSTPAPTHVAFLRGINVGGNNPIKMADIVKIFDTLKCRDIKTILASGNVLFTPPSQIESSADTHIQAAIKKSFKKDIGVIVVSLSDIQKLVDSGPFKKVTESPTTRLHVTILSENPKLKVKLPHKTEKGDLTIVAVGRHSLCWVAHLIPGRHSGMCTQALERMIGKNVTTRSWNTIVKIAAAADGT